MCTLLRNLSDSELTARFGDLVVEEQERAVAILDHIGELDRRKLFYHYASLRAFLVEEHGMEDWLAERRIRLARALSRHPELREEMLRGKLNATLIEIALGCAHREKLSDPELVELAQALSGKSTRAARREVAARYPLRAELPKDRIRPLNETHSELRCVISNELADWLEVELPGFLAHSHPGASIGERLEVMRADYRKRHHPEERAKRAQARKASQAARSEMLKTPAPPDQGALPQREARHFSEAQGHELTLRDGYGCAFRDPVTGLLCGSTFGLEKDHVQPWSAGGATEVRNARYLCKRHHARVSFLRFGENAKFSHPKRE